MATTTTYDDISTFNLVIKVPIDIMDDLQQIATTSGKDIHDMIIDYTREGILQNMSMTKRRNFFTNTKNFLKKHHVQQEYVDEFAEKFTY